MTNIRLKGGFFPKLVCVLLVIAILSVEIFGACFAEATTSKTNTKPTFTVYLPTKISTKNKTIVISITNNKNSKTTYFDGSFAIEDLATGNVYDAKCTKYERVSTGTKKSYPTGKRLALKAGEKVRFTCTLDDTFDYAKSNVRMTACMRYNKKDYVSVYSTQAKNKVYTVSDYYIYLNEK